MSDLVLPILLVLGLFLLERVGVMSLTRSSGGRDWVRSHRFAHPNAICLARIPMGIVSILLWKWLGPAAALVWFAFWMITDLTDGTIARSCDLVTERGKWLDPLSDKCMVLPPLVFLALVPGVSASPPASIVIAFAVVDVAGQLSRLFAQRTSANLFGKTKTGAVTLLLGFVALHQISPVPGVTPTSVAFLAGIALVLAVLSAAGKILARRAYAGLLIAGTLLAAGLALVELVQGRLLRGAMLVLLPIALKLLDVDFSLPAGSSRLAKLGRDLEAKWRRLPETARVGVILALLTAGCMCAAHVPA
ncbi:MAG: CDP-alcohol phosphatidyltransferase family protein [Verrucomicrobiota bacterium]